jgi:hypothetical protein
VVVAQVAELRLGERFCGPAASANGGYACGAIAELLGGGVEVTLRRPPPLGRPPRLRVGDGGALVDDGDELIDEAQPATVALALPEIASPTEAPGAWAVVEDTVMLRALASTASESRSFGARPSRQPQPAC